MLPNYKKYMKEKHGWNHKTETEVDWELLKTCTKSVQEADETVCKLVNDQIPT